MPCMQVPPRKPQRPVLCAEPSALRLQLIPTEIMKPVVFPLSASSPI
jgi:hypothetical protein